MKSINQLLVLALILLGSQCQYDSLHENVVFIGDRPQADFSVPVDLKACAKDCGVQFTNNSTNAVAFEWDFGDGEVSNQQNPYHVYSAPGTYTVKLKAINQNSTDEFSSQIEIEGAITFQKTYGGSNTDVGQFLIRMNDGTYVVFGYVESKDFPGLTLDTDYKVLYMRIDSSGNILNQALYGTEEAGASIEGVALYDQNNAMIIGQNNRAWTFSINPGTGGMLWDHEESPDPFGPYWDAIVAHPNGDFFVSGSYSSNIILRKVSASNFGYSSGLEKKISGSSYSGMSMAVAKDGGLLLVSLKATSNNSDIDPILTKFDLAFNVQWQKEGFGGSSHDWIRKMLVDSQGNIYMIGSSTSFTNGESDVFIIKTDANGNFIDQANFGTSVEEVGFNAIINSDGEIVITGRAENPSNSSIRNAYLLKINTGLQKIWERYYDTSSSYGGQAIIETDDGGYLITGQDNQDILLIKTDVNGQIAE